MAPIRRYLRITQYSVLEVRIYLDNPALAQTWLLNARDPVLPRVMQAVRPLVLPKLREENERVKGKSKRAKGIKDTVSEDDFEVSIFLTELSSPHSLLTKQKDFRNQRRRLKSNSSKLTGWLTGTEAEPVEVNEDEDPIVIREESDDEQGPKLQDFPEANVPRTVQKRARERTSEEHLAAEDVSDDEGFDMQPNSPSELETVAMDESGRGREEEEGEDKKKLRLNASYDGFSVYGRILCLVVKRKGTTGKAASGDASRGLASAGGGGQQMMENWVSTQAAQEQGILD